MFSRNPLVSNCRKLYQCSHEVLFVFFEFLIFVSSKGVITNLYISTLRAAGEKQFTGRVRQNGSSYTHFYTARRRQNKIGSFFSEKGARYTHFYTTSGIRNKIGVFLFLCQKGANYTHFYRARRRRKNNFGFFFVSKQCRLYTFFQNSNKVPATHIFYNFKKVPVIHISGI